MRITCANEAISYFAKLGCNVLQKECDGIAYWIVTEKNGQSASFESLLEVWAEWARRAAREFQEVQTFRLFLHAYRRASVAERLRLEEWLACVSSHIPADSELNKRMQRTKPVNVDCSPRNWKAKLLKVRATPNVGGSFHFASLAQLALSNLAEGREIG